MYVSTYILMHLQAYRHILLNYLIIYLSGGITHQLKQACFDKTGSQTRCQQWSTRKQNDFVSSAAALFLRRSVMSLCKRSRGKGRAPLAEGQYEDTEKQAKDLRGFVKQCEKL